MSPAPWPLIGRVHPVPPIVQAARETRGVRYVPTPRRPAPEPLSPAEASGTRYPWGRRTGWLAAEAAVLDALAAAGGDLTAHRTVHLEDR